jgi:nucleoside-diphosphate-sugar epimerase
LRLGAVYGEHDYQHSFEPVLRRIRAGRMRMPIGAGGWLFSRVYAGDVAQAALAALAVRGTGECFNVVEAQTAPIRLFYERLISAAGASLELVRVRDEALPSDLRSSAPASQHLLASSVKARAVLRWDDTADLDTLRRAVKCNLDHPPSDPDTDFSGDDAALLQAC